MKPTTKDLAREAGVSLATVDRVLNGRAGVNKATIEIVQAAAARIGFVRNLSASNLARKKIYQFLFLLPHCGGEFLQAIINHIDEAKERFIDSSVFIEYKRVLDGDPHQAVGLLAKIIPEQCNGLAIMAAESPQLRDAIMRLEEKGVHVVRLISGSQGSRPFSFAGIDNYAAGATAGRLLGKFCGARSGKIMMVTENLQAMDAIERRLGFDYIITQDYHPKLITLPSLETYNMPDRTAEVIANAYHNHPDIIAVYIFNSEARLPLEAIFRLKKAQQQIIIAHEQTAYTRQKLKEKAIDALIVQDPGHVVRSAVRLLKAQCDGVEPLVSQEKIRIEILLRENLQ